MKKQLLLLILCTFLLVPTVFSACGWDEGDWNNGGWDQCTDVVVGGGVGSTQTAADGAVPVQEPVGVSKEKISMLESTADFFEKLKQLWSDHKVLIIGSVVAAFLVLTSIGRALLKTVVTLIASIIMPFLAFGLISLIIIIVLVIVVYVWLKSKGVF